MHTKIEYSKSNVPVARLEGKLGALSCNLLIDTKKTWTRTKREPDDKFRERMGVEDLRRHEM